MRAIVQKSEIYGSIESPPSKSYTHRALVCALLSSETTRIRNSLLCDDTMVTLQFLELMGADVNIESDIVITGPNELVAPIQPMDCKESGTSLRFFTAISSLAKGVCVLTCAPSLQRRPISELISALNQLGIKSSSLKNDGRPPVEILGNASFGGSAEIRGDVSSQYISGLLLACAKGQVETRIKLTTHLESRPYVEMTLDVMEQFGVVVEPSEKWDSFSIPGEQEYRLSKYDIEGDYSSAAFLMVAGALTGQIQVNGLSKNTNQGDARIVTLLQEMGVSINSTRKGCIVNKSEPTSLDIDASNIPDLVPILAVLATISEGTTCIRNAKRLRYKESDRLAAITQELKKMGANISETEDAITIIGPTKLHGAIVDSHGDHRIGMACAVAGFTAEGTTVIEGIECLSKSYPQFIEDMQSVGGQIKISQGSETEVKK